MDKNQRRSKSVINALLREMTLTGFKKFVARAFGA